MLPDELWHVLGLEPRVAIERAAFFEAFAKLAADPPSPQPAQLAELSRFSDPRPGLEAFGEPPGADGVPRLENIEPELPALDRPAWEQVGFEADALRQAAVSALLVDTQRGLSLLAEAGGRYRAASPAFAMLLRTVTNPSQAVAKGAAEALGALYFGGETRLLDRTEPINEVQEVHLALAASSFPEVVDRDLLTAFAGQPAARSSASFGTGAAAVFEWWWFAMTLLQGAMGEPSLPSRGSLAAQLVRFARGHGRQLELAKLDAYHWRKLGGHTELVDLDVACAVCLASRQLAALGEQPFSADEFDYATEMPLDSRIDLPRSMLAQVSLRVGLEMARPNEDPPPAATTSGEPLVNT